jgi:hypothetical protein
MSNSRRASVALAALALSVPTAALADVLIVRSTGPSAATYPVRTRLPDNSRIVLSAGDRVVLVGPAGTRTLIGPGRFQAAPILRTVVGRQRTAARYAAVLAQGGTRQSAGAIRRDNPNVPAPPRHPGQGLWSFPLGLTGTVCTPDPTLMFLTRPASGPPITVRIARASQPNARQDIALPANSIDALWTAYPISDGSDFIINTLPASAPSRVRFVLLPASPASPVELAELLAERGCTEQLDRLVALMEVNP